MLEKAYKIIRRKAIMTNYRFLLNIQNFAEDPKPGDPAPEDTSVSMEEFKKMKNAFDKASSELAEFKKKQKENLPEMERMIAENKELKESKEKAERELFNTKLSSMFTSSGFDEKTTGDLVNAYNSEDRFEFFKKITDYMKQFREKTEQEAQTKFQKNQKIPGGTSGKDGNEEDEYFKTILEKNRNAKPTDILFKERK